MRIDRRDIAVTGAEADLEFSDLWKFRTKSGELRLDELRVGRLPMRAVKVDLGLWDGKKVIVNAVEFRALGAVAETARQAQRIGRRVVAPAVLFEVVDIGVVAPFAVVATALQVAAEAAE